MVITFVRAATAAAAALALSLPVTSAHAAEKPAAVSGVAQVLPIGVAVSALPVALEDRTGYQRTSFKHWNAGDLPADGCNTRQEVLLAEAVVYPEIGPGCTLTGGLWSSYYDGVQTTDSRQFDIDPHGPARGGVGLWGVRVDGCTARGVRERPGPAVLAGGGHGPLEPQQGGPGPGPVAAAIAGCAVQVRRGVDRDEAAVGPGGG